MPKKTTDPFPVVDKFVEDALRRKRSVFMGIDPGVSGAIAFLCGNRYSVIDIPVYTIGVTRHKKTTDEERAATGHKSKSVAGTTTEANHAQICAIFDALRPIYPNMTVVLEDVPTSLGFGRKHAEAKLNRAFAMWPLFLYSKGLRILYAKPSVWKETLGLTGKEKEESRLLALEFFPDADINRKEDVDRAEALLLARYGYVYLT